MTLLAILCKHPAFPSVTVNDLIYVKVYIITQLGKYMFDICEYIDNLASIVLITDNDH